MIDLDAALATLDTAKPILIMLDGKRLRYVWATFGRLPHIHILTWIDAADVNYTAHIHPPALRIRASGRLLCLCRTVQR